MIKVHCSLFVKTIIEWKSSKCVKLVKVGHNVDQNMDKVERKKRE